MEILVILIALFALLTKAGIINNFLEIPFLNPNIADCPEWINDGCHGF